MVYQRSTDISEWELPFLHRLKREQVQLQKYGSQMSAQQSHVEGVLKHRLLGPPPRGFDSVSLGKDPRICISNKFPFDAEVAIL